MITRREKNKKIASEIEREHAIRLSKKNNGNLTNNCLYYNSLLPIYEIYRNGFHKN